MSLGSLQSLVDGIDDVEIVAPDGSWAALQCERVHTDTRTMRRGDLYVAIQGLRFDGNTLLADACDAGAIAVVCQGDAARAALPFLRCPAFVVPDTRRALGQIARGHCSRSTALRIAIAGSNGKTTVTQMVGAMLRCHAGDASLATEGNRNNDIGVPLTLLALLPKHRYAVVELGTNHPGEIAVLAGIAQPSIALVNNAQRDHVEFFASVDDVARENGEALQTLPASGTAVYPADDPCAPIWAQRADHCRRVTFSATVGIDATLQLRAAHWHADHWRMRISVRDAECNSASESAPESVYECVLPMAGLHNVRNALAAAACAMAAGVPWVCIAEGLATFTPVRGRSQVYRRSVRGHGLTIVDDTYNANPDSVRAAIDLLASLPAPQWLVVGDMGELGADAVAMHREVLEYAASSLQGEVFALGPLFAKAAEGGTQQGAAVHAVGESRETLMASILQALPGAGSVLCKGSRLMRMETVVEGILAACDGFAYESQGRCERKEFQPC